MDNAANNNTMMEEIAEELWWGRYLRLAEQHWLRVPIYRARSYESEI